MQHREIFVKIDHNTIKQKKWDGTVIVKKKQFCINPNQPGCCAKRMHTF